MRGFQQFKSSYEVIEDFDDNWYFCGNSVEPVDNRLVDFVASSQKDGRGKSIVMALVFLISRRSKREVKGGYVVDVIPIWDCQ